MRCPRCGHENPKTVELCQGCRKVRFIRKRPRSRVSPAIQPEPLKGEKKHLLLRPGAPPIELDRAKPFTIGRNADCTLPIPSERVSRVHAEIRWKEGRFVLTDKGSANGTFVRGEPVTTRALEPGDEIEIGGYICVYRRGDPQTFSVPPTKYGATIIDGGDLVRGKIDRPGSLSEVLQGLEFHRKTGTLVVYSKDVQGWITFRDGALLAAEAGKRKDKDAVLKLLGVGQGTFSFTRELRSEEKRLRTNVTAILLEWGRRTDEGSG